MIKVLLTLSVLFVMLPISHAGKLLDKIDSEIAVAKELKSGLEELRKIVQTTPAATIKERKLFIKSAWKVLGPCNKNIKHLVKKTKKIIKAVNELQDDYSGLIGRIEELNGEIDVYSMEANHAFPSGKDEDFIEMLEQCGHDLRKTYNSVEEYIGQMSKLRKKIAAANAMQI